ncbi:MAG: hypothetical protein JZU70_02575, partial [Chlorobium sp.]|nr:hypothetical protein [Chlorobium sp.]
APGSGNPAGILALSTKNVYAAGDIYLGGDTVTQSSGSTINADYNNGSLTGGSIRIDGGGSTNNITLSGTLTTDNASSTAIQIVNATNATLNVVSATAGTVALGIPANTDGGSTPAKPLTGTVSQVETTGTISAATLAGNAGIVTITKSNIDNLGVFTTTGALTLQDQGGTGTAGLKFTGNVTVGGTTDIETTDGVLDFDEYDLNATGQAITLKGVVVSQTTGSQINATTADIYGSTGSIDLFSTLNDFTGQVTVHSTGSQVSVQDATKLSMNTLTGNIGQTTSIKLWAGTLLELTSESITTTTGNIEFRSLDGNLSTPGNLTTGAGNVSLYASTTTTTGNVQVNNTITTGTGDVHVEAEKEVNLSKSILSTSGDISVIGNTVIHSTGSTGDPLSLLTGSAGTITVNANGTGGFVMGQYYSYQSDTGTIAITSGNTADLSNITTNGTLTVDAVGLVQQVGTGSTLAADALRVTTANNGIITLTNATNDVNKLKLLSRNTGNTAVGSGTITFNDTDGFAVSQISTTGNATLTANGAITTDSTVFGDGSVVADALSVKSFDATGSDILLTATTNDVNTLTLKVRNANDSAIAGNTTGAGTIYFTDSDGLSITSIETGGSTVLTAGDAVTQTGGITSAKLGLSGAGAYTLNEATNAFSTFASDATGAVKVQSSLALTIGSVNPTGVTTNGARFELSAPSISITEAINTTSSVAATVGGDVVLTATSSGTDGSIVSSSNGTITTSGSAATSGNANGGAAGNMTLTAGGGSITVGKAITASGGAGFGSGHPGLGGTVKLLAASGAVTQEVGAGGITAAQLRLKALDTSYLNATNNAASQIVALISGVGKNFTYRSGSDFAVKGAESEITGITTQGGFVDIGSSDVAVSVDEAVITLGGAFSATNVKSFDSLGITINTTGDITLAGAGGVYKHGGNITILTTNSGAITTGTLTSNGYADAGEAHGGAITLTADGVLTIGTTNARGVLTGTGGAVNLTGSSVRISGSIVTSSTGDGVAGGNIAITGPAILDNGDYTLSTGAGPGNISFSSTINSDGTPHDLSLIAGTGDISITGVVGGTSSLGAINITSAKDVTASQAITAASFTQQAGTGTSTLSGTTTLGGNLSFIGTNLAVNAGVDATGTVTVSNSNLFTTAAAGDITAALGFTQNGAGSNELAGDISTTNTNIGFTTGVTLKDNVVMGTNTGAGNIVFSETVDSYDTTPRTLTLNAGTGAITFTKAVGSSNKLGAMQLNSSGTTTFSASVAASSVTTDAVGTTAINGGAVTTTGGTQLYNDAVTLGSNTFLTGSTITTKGTVSGGSGYLLKVEGAAVFGDEAGDTVTGLTTLEVTGTTTINSNTITSANAQTYTGAVTIGAADTVLSSTAAGAILFSNTVNSAASAANALTVSSGLGAVTFTDVVGGGANGAVGALLVNSGGLTKFTKAVTAASVVTNSAGTVEVDGNVTTSGIQHYGELFTLGADVALSGTTVTFDNTVNGTGDGSEGLSITGNAVFSNTVGGTSGKALQYLTVSDTTSLAGNVTTNTGAQSYSGAVTLTGPVTLTGTGGMVSLNGGVTGGAKALTIDASTVNLGDGTGADALGGLASLGVTGTTTIKASSIGTGSGAQTYIGDVLIGKNDESGNTGPTLTAGTATFKGAVNSVASETNTLTITGHAVIGDGTGTDTIGQSAALTSLSVSGTTLFAANANFVTTTGDQTYSQAVTLDDTLVTDYAFISTASGDIEFSGTVNGASTDGNATLNVNTSGATIFGGAVGITNSLAALNTDSGGTTKLNGNVTTSGAQSYGDAVEVQSGIALQTIDNLVSFGSTVDSQATEHNSLTVSSGSGAVIFTGAVGSATNGKLGALLISTASDVTAESTIDAASVVQSAGTGTTTLRDNVTTTAIGGVNLTANAISLDGLTINTNSGNGVVRLNGATTLDGATVITRGSGSVSFTSTLDSKASAANALTIDGFGGGAVTFTGAVGSVVNGKLGALLISTASDVTAESTIDAASVVQSAGTGTTTLRDNVTTTAIGGVNLTANAISLDGLTINTNSGNGVVRLNGATTLDGATVITRGSGSVSFTSTLDSKASAANALTIDGFGGGAVTFTGAVGSVVNGKLGALLISTASDVTATSITAASLTQSAGSGMTTLNGTVTLSGANGNFAFIGTNLTLNAGMDAGGTVTVTNSGLFTTAAPGDITATGGFTQDGGGSNELAGDISTTDTNIGFATGVTLKGNVVMDTGAGAGNILFSSTVDSDATLARNLTLNAGTGNITFTDQVGTTHALGSMLLNSSGTTMFTDTIKAGSVTTNIGGTTAINGGVVMTTGGTQVYSDNVTLGGNAVLTGTTVTTLGTVSGSDLYSLKVAGAAVFGDAAADTVTGLTTLEVTGTTAINTDTITTTGTQTYTGPVTLGVDSSLTTSGDAIVFSSTVDSDVTLARSLTLKSVTAVQNFGGAVGGTHPFATLSIESAGVTQGGTAYIKADKLAIKSSGAVTLESAGSGVGNDVNVLAAELASSASLSFVDVDGLTIGTIGSISGISDGTGTSNVTLKVGGLLDQAASSLIALKGNLTIDTSSFDADDVSFKNTVTGGTVLENSLVAGDFTLVSNGNVTQSLNVNGTSPNQTDAYLQVGGAFNLTGGTFIQGNSADNLFGGGGGGSSPANQIKLLGVITLRMNGTTLHADATTNGTTVTSFNDITLENRGSGISVISDAGGKSISTVANGNAVQLGQSNSVGGFVKITTKGTYGNAGSPVATGILQSTALNLGAASFMVQQSTENTTSSITGQGVLNLNTTGNIFSGVVSLTSLGMDASLQTSDNLTLGAVNVGKLTITASSKNITQDTGTILRATELALASAGTVTLNNANLVGTLTGATTGEVQFRNEQALIVGVTGLSTTNSPLTLSLLGDLTLTGTLGSGSNSTSIVALAGMPIFL